MNKTTEALNLAEEALKYADTTCETDRQSKRRGEALAAIREALAKPVQQEPVAKVTDVFPTRVEWLREVTVNSLLYAASVQPVKQEPVAKYQGIEGEYAYHILKLYEDIPEGTLLYAAPVDAKAIRAEALKDAADRCKEFYTIEGIAQQCEAAIRGMK